LSNRDIAERFNARYGETFVVPEHRIPSVAARVKDLQSPEARMSTTAGTEQGTVYILDEPDAVRRKFKSAVTDTGREVVRAPDKPGISNLIEIMSVATGESLAEVQARYDGQGYGAFKEEVAEAVIALLEPFQTRFHELRSDAGELQRLLAHGAEKARAASAPTLQAMYHRMGFVRLP